jgi:hypothetical protein
LSSIFLYFFYDFFYEGWKGRGEGPDLVGKKSDRPIS